MLKNAFGAIVVCALVVVLVGCSRGRAGNCDPCGAPDPCQPSCDPCDPCAGRPAGMPEEAKMGEAWCRVLIPAKYEETERQVCTCPESCDREWIPPVYEEQERKVCCKPASCRSIPIAAEYETRTEKVCTCPARTVWKKIPCEPGSLGDGEKQGDCWQLSEIPAQYKEVCKRVCVKPASSRQETTPPEYKTITEKVMVKPGEWKTSTTPAQYKTVKGRKLVEPCRWEWRRNADCEVPDAAVTEEASAADATSEAASDATSDADASESDSDGDGAADAADGLGAPPAGSVDK